MHRDVFPQWSPPPHKPSLQQGRIDVWRIDLAQSPDDIKLNASLRAKSGQNAVCPPTDQRATAHLAMRDILSRYLDSPPEALQIKAQPGGKPYLHAPAARLEFNLSHSKDIALLAVARSVGLGIDVETFRPITDPLRIAKRVMSTAECDELGALSGTACIDRFLNLWTRLEARQKAVGLGIFAQAADQTQLSSFGFRPGSSKYASLCTTPPIADPELRFIDFRAL